MPLRVGERFSFVGWVTLSLKFLSRGGVFVLRVAVFVVVLCLGVLIASARWPNNRTVQPVNTLYK